MSETQGTSFNLASCDVRFNPSLSPVGLEGAFFHLFAITSLRPKTAFLSWSFFVSFVCTYLTYHMLYITDHTILKTTRSFVYNKKCRLELIYFLCVQWIKITFALANHKVKNKVSWWFHVSQLETFAFTFNATGRHFSAFEVFCAKVLDYKK